VKHPDRRKTCCRMWCGGGGSQIVPQLPALRDRTDDDVVVCCGWGST